MIRLPQPFKGVVRRLAFADQPEGTLLDARDVLPFDCKTDRMCLAVRPGFGLFWDGIQQVTGAAGLYTIGVATGASHGVELLVANSTTLYRWTGSGWSSVGTIPTTSGRAIHAAPLYNTLYIACNTSGSPPNHRYRKYTHGGSVSEWYASTAGVIPQNCQMITEWAGRIVMASSSSRTIFFSAIDDPEDWDYTATSFGRATQVAIDEVPTALIPHNRDCLLVGAKGAMHAFRGDPTGGGHREKFAFVVGPINSTAWCKSSDDWVWFLAHDGLYRIPPGCGDPPEPISRDSIPRSLVGLDGVSNVAVVGYDERWRLIHIYVSGPKAQHWLYDITAGGFWPITAPGSDIRMVHRFGPIDDITSSGTLIATGGGVRRLESTEPLGGSQKAYATFLLPIAKTSEKTLIEKSHVVFSEQTTDTDAKVQLLAGENAERLAAGLDVRASSEITFQSLKNNHWTWHPRVGGTYAMLKITQNSTSHHFSIETIGIEAAPSGVERG